MAEIELPKPGELHEIKEKAFTRRVALVTAFFAVILAIAALGGNYTMKEMLLTQQQSSDQWAFYQAKVIREHLYRAQKMRLEVDLLEKAGSMKAEVRERLEKLLKTLAAEEARYASEKKEIEQEAKKLERERDHYRSKDPFFEFAEVLLQIAIVMATIAIIANSRRIFIFACAAAALGTILTLNGFFLFLPIPLFH